MSPSRSLPDEARRAAAMQALILKGIVGNALRVLIVLLEHSYAIGMDAARFDSQRELAEMLLELDKGDLSAALRELEERKIVRTYRHAMSWWYELQPIEGWAPAIWRKREPQPGAETLARKVWKTTIEHARSDPRQAELIPQKATEAGDCGLSAAMKKVGPGPTSSHAPPDPGDKVGLGPTLPETVERESWSTTNFPKTATAARVPARADHDSDSDDPTDHDHEHERRVAAEEEAESGSLWPVWTELHEEKMALVLEVCQPAAPSRSQREEWKKRIRKSPSLVEEVCREVERVKKEGKLRRADNPGCLLNRLYLDWSGEKKKIFAKGAK